MNICSSLLLYVFLLLKNNLVDSLEIQFKFKSTTKIDPENRYSFVRVSDYEGHYFFARQAKCFKVVVDGVVLWNLNEAGMCPGAVSYYGTDQVAINFPDKMLVFEKINGEWMEVSTPKNNEMNIDLTDVFKTGESSEYDSDDLPGEQDLKPGLLEEPNEQEVDLNEESQGGEQTTDASEEQGYDATSLGTDQSGTDNSAPAVPSEDE